MKRTALFFCLLPIFGFGQNLFFSVRAGLASYNGDLKRKSFSFSQSSFLGSVGARYDFSEHITGRVYLSYATLRADDKKGNAAMKSRNLNFKTSLIDLEAGAQYNFLDLNY